MGSDKMVYMGSVDDRDARDQFLDQPAHTPVVDPNGRWVIVTIEQLDTGGSFPYIMEQNSRSNPRLLSDDLPDLFQNFIAWDWSNDGRYLSIIARPFTDSSRVNKIGWAEIEPIPAGLLMRNIWRIILITMSGWSIRMVTIRAES